MKICEFLTIIIKKNLFIFRAHNFFYEIIKKKEKLKTKFNIQEFLMF